MYSALTAFVPGLRGQQALPGAALHLHGGSRGDRKPECLSSGPLPTLPSADFSSNSAKPKTYKKESFVFKRESKGTNSIYKVESSGFQFLKYIQLVSKVYHSSSLACLAPAAIKK